jgi:tetratricopeptide (TPR) repeat protein
LSTNPAELLKSHNPEDRMQGIRIVAGMRSEKALRVLMKIYKQDPDEGVRAMAKKGASVVAERLREQQAAVEQVEEEAYEDPLAIETVEVSAKAERRAKAYLDEAMDHQMIEDREKAVKALKKALDANPNIAKDNYFQSVAASVMEKDAESAVRDLVREDKRRDLIQADKQKKTDASIADHMAEAEKFGWASLAIDIILFSLVMFFGGLLSVMVIDFSAEANFNQIQAQFETTVDENGASAPPKLDRNDPEQAEAVANAEARLEVAQVVVQVMNVGLGALLGATLLFVFLPALIVYGLVTSPIATRLFNGHGTGTYAIHNLLSVYITPALVSFGVIIVVAILVFLVGLLPLSIGLIVIGGILSVISLVVTIRMLLAIAKTYKFGFGPALLTAIVASIPANIIMGVVGGVLGGLLAGAFATLNAAVGAI